ncbi:ATP/maltotriose-dependent transcriptional regulator MalT [Chitinivorax tropicus]|uniref:ATP/maltotriose-dependent transcriptional regulator MalT n=1 Tax=Chitinivorax tropicus TaxID=714531 RepID=A0A840MLS7_9PROT|nr:LuxR C-terminal-related transcriptional regulator [Chitinivorax tropicus]MBB5017662.1 ATP/maltotriose-dependent transcriptional regulator MalT [Chitinivorax tropicus]
MAILDPSTSSLPVPNPTKLQPPPAPLGWVVRQRLLDRFAQQTNARLVVIHAPAGYGKTIWMQQCWQQLLRRRPDQADGLRWLRVDTTDNDPVRLSIYLQALSAPSVEHAEDGVYYCFIDDLDQLDHPEALATMRLWLAQQLPTMTVVLGARVLPALGLARLQLHHPTLTIDSQMLAYDLVELQQHAMTLGIDLALDTQQMLLTQTGGWPAAIQMSLLASSDELALQQHLADRYHQAQTLLHYLVDEVISTLPAAAQDFLLDTCGFDPLSPALCDAATGRRDSEYWLNWLAQQGLFTSVHTTTPRQYRYHALFADCLRLHQQHRRAPIQIQAVLRGGARHLAQQGEVQQAIALWLQAGDITAAIREIADQASELVIQAQFVTLNRWLARLPPDGELPLTLLLSAAWSAGFAGELAQAAAWLARLMPFADQLPEARQGELAVLQPILQAVCGHIDDALRQGEALVPTVPDSQHFAAGALHNMLAYCQTLAARFGDAQRSVAEARRHNEAIGSGLGLGYALSIQGLIEASQGQLDQALSCFEQADRMAHLQLRQHWFEPGHVKAMTIGLTASLHYEQGRVEMAAALLDDYLPLMRHLPSLDLYLLAVLTRCRCRLALGQSALALSGLDDAEREAQAWQFERIHHIAMWERIRIDLIEGQITTATQRWATFQPPKPDADWPVMPSHTAALNGAGIEWARYWLSTGQAALAAEQLALAEAHAQRTGQRWRRLRLLILMAQAQAALQLDEAAHQSLMAALTLGAAMQAQRSFLDEGPALLHQLAGLDGATIGQAGGESLRQYHQALLQTALIGPTPDTLLSERELAILQLLATGMANEQIAEQVHLSVHTVKWHIRRMLGKLSARNRSEAVFQARRLGLLA